MSKRSRCRQAPYSKLIYVTLAGLGLFAATSARAADSCSVDSVIQPAIDGAASASSCNADGVYLAPAAFANILGSKCKTIKNLNKCRLCVKELSGRELDLSAQMARLGLLGLSDVREIKGALDAARKGLCVAPPKPTATPTPKPTPTGAPGNGGEEIGAQLLAACPCKGSFTSHDSFVQCASNFLNGLLAQAKVTQDNATNMLNYVSHNTTCGAPEHTPAPTPSPKPSPTPGGTEPHH